ncbi:MAG: hypothetical protein KC457_34435, partial [Myxococcales bacterium]|nr:hypothetical protein [Myxococcales bacterium]
LPAAVYAAPEDADSEAAAPADMEADDVEADDTELAEAGDEVDPSNPDAVDGDLGAIDDVGGDTADTAQGQTLLLLLPPRVDGPYVGAVFFGNASFVSVLNLDTPAPFVGGGAHIQAGDAVFPWMSIGVAVGGQAGVAGNQRLAGGSLLVEFGFLPIPRRPLSIRAGFGFGGGTVQEAGVTGRSGYGGAMFKGSLRYDFFPLAAKKRPDRGGGWSLGPEIGWLGATPAAKGQPFVNTIIFGLSTAMYFGS